MTSSDVITIEDLPEDFMYNFKIQPTTEKNMLKDNEYKIIVETIDRHGWDVKGKTLAAKELGIGLRTLYRKLN